MPAKEKSLRRTKLEKIPVHVEQIQIPDDAKGVLPQDLEWCFVTMGGKQRKIRFHDYATIYNIPGLYEGLFYDRLKCCSPLTVARLLEGELEKSKIDPESLSVLDLGAGNGMVGEELRAIGVEKVVGTDILPQARRAAFRDRSGIYQNYIVTNFLNLSKSTERIFKKYSLNCLTTVATLGFHDIPTKVFLNALSLISVPGWLAFNIKEDFLQEGDITGFSKLIRELSEEGVLEVKTHQRYQHRLSARGEPLYYLAVVAKLLRPLPASRI